MRLDQFLEFLFQRDALNEIKKFKQIRHLEDCLFFTEDEFGDYLEEKFGFNEMYIFDPIDKRFTSIIGLENIGYININEQYIIESLENENIICKVDIGENLLIIVVFEEW